jgi:antitoxin component of MazEF toxin-antitoxin module
MRIPEEILEKMKLTEGSVVDVEVINGSIIISKI